MFVDGSWGYRTNRTIYGRRRNVLSDPHGPVQGCIGRSGPFKKAVDEGWRMGSGQLLWVTNPIEVVSWGKRKKATGLHGRAAASHPLCTASLALCGGERRTPWHWVGRDVSPAGAGGRGHYGGSAATRTQKAD